MTASLAAAGTAAALLGVACGLDLAGEAPAKNLEDSGKMATPEAQSGSSSGGPGGADVASVPDSVAADGGSDGESDDGPDGGSDSDAELANDAPDAPDAPVVAPPDFAWYKLDETSGNVAHDSTAHHYDVTLTNVTWDMGANFALPNGGAGSGGSTNVGAGLRQAPVSFTAWLAPASRSDETSNAYAIQPYPPNAVSADVAGQYGFGIGLNVWTDGAPGSAFSAENVGYQFLNGGSQFMASVEYFVAAAIGSATASLYVNGQVVGTANTTTPGPSGMNPLRLGYHNEDPGYGTKRFYAGRMRDVRVYKRVLMAAEVAALYTTGPAP